MCSNCVTGVGGLAPYLYSFYMSPTDEVLFLCLAVIAEYQLLGNQCGLYKVTAFAPENCMPTS